jgi:hypothetical protein
VSSRGTSRSGRSNLPLQLFIHSPKLAAITDKMSDKTPAKPKPQRATTSSKNRTTDSPPPYRSHAETTIEDLCVALLSYNTDREMVWRLQCSGHKRSSCCCRVGGGTAG